MGSHQYSWIFLLAAIWVSNACDLYEFSPCDEECGGGIQMAVTRMCNSTSGDPSYPCSYIEVPCNSAPCIDDFSDWNECSAACGYGERMRFDMSGAEQTMFCSLTSCDPVNCTDRPTDIVFVVDKSSSITDYGFEVYKQLVSDVVSMLPTGGSVRVAMVSFSVEASIVFEFTNNPSSSDILGDQFSGGTGILAYGLEMVSDLFESSENVSKVAVFLTDGEQMILEACAYELSTQLQQSGVDMYAVGFGPSTMVNLNPISSMPFDEHQFQAGYNSTAMKMANAILSISCGESNLLTIVYDDEETFNQNMAGLMQAGTADKTCTDLIAEGPCVCPEGQTTGKQKVKIICTQNRESVTENLIEDCHCPGQEPDCSRCDYTKGQIWLQDSRNCHDYYICEKVDTWAGRYWTHHHVSCGLLYWDQTRLTCTTVIQPDCEDQVGSTREQPPTTEGVCMFETVDGNPAQFRSTKDGSLQECVGGMVFVPIICGCIPDSEIEFTCGGDLLLDFPFDNDFDDITCHHAQGFPYGDGTVSLVDDPDRGMVAYFDGSSRIEVPFMRNWFRDRCTTQFTVMFWVKPDADFEGNCGLVHNADCINNEASFLVSGNIGTTSTDFTGQIKTSSVVVVGPLSDGDNLWHEVALVYDGEFIWMIVDGELVSEEPQSGCISNVQNPMIIGAGWKCCPDDMEYFKGRIDDLRVYTKAVTFA